jgi:hypothetical protein
LPTCQFADLGPIGNIPPAEAEDRYYAAAQRHEIALARESNQTASDASAHASEMFAVTGQQAAAIRTAFEQHGELSAMVELCRRFRGITDVEQASLPVGRAVRTKDQVTEADGW